MKTWRTLLHNERLRLHINAHRDITFFAENPWFLDLRNPRDPTKGGLWPKQRWVLEEFYTYVDGQRKYNELWLLAGMRSSKTTIGGIINCYEAYKLNEMTDPAVHYGLLPNSQIFLINVATKEKQALDTIFRKTEERIDASPYFQELSPPPYKVYGEYRLHEDQIVIRAGGSNSASLVGKTNKIVFEDELARFLNTSGQRAGRSVHESLTRGTATFGLEGLIVVTSSPQFEDDPFMVLREEAKSNPYALVPEPIPTWDFNPHLKFDGPYLTAKRLENPEAFWRDFGCIPGLAIEAYYTQPGKISVNPNRLNLAEYETVTPEPKRYYLWADPGAKGTAYGIAIGHYEPPRVIIDFIKRFVPEKGAQVNVRLVREYIGTLLKRFPIADIGFDVAVDTETEQEVRLFFEDLKIHNILKPEHDALKARIYQNQIDICNYTYLIAELKALRIRDSRYIEPASNKFKDVADAVAGVVWLIEEEQGRRLKKETDVPTPLYYSRILVPRKW